MNKYLQESYEDSLRENELLKAKLEQAEKAFEEINYQFELHEHEVIDNAIKKVDDIATEALQAIRGN